jgi:AcrR family transcriptional regulator
MNEADPRVKRTRKLLIQAFVELLREKGFRSLSVQDIAERATVNRATFYAHFEDKYALMEDYIREGFQQKLSGSLSVSEPFTVDNLRLLIRTVFEYLGHVRNNQCQLSSDKQQVEPLFEATVQGELYQFLLEWLKQLPEPGHQCRTAVDTAAMTMSWGIFGAGLQWSRSAKKAPLEEMTGQVLAVLTGGLSEAMEFPFLEQAGQSKQRTS